MDERLSVDALDGAGGKNGIVIAVRTRLRRGQAENRTHALAARKEAVANGAMNRRRFDRRLRKKAIKRGVHLTSTFTQITLQRWF